MKKMRRILSLLLASVLLLTFCPCGLMSVSATQSRTGSFLKTYILTGDPEDDMLAIAQAQLGRSQSEMGYSEAWCADFVCDCAKLADQESAIPFYGGCTTLFSLVKQAGGQVVSDRQKGDLVFYYCSACKCYVHVGLVLSKTYSIEGNYSNKVTKVTSSYKHTSNNSTHSIANGYISRVYVRPAYTRSGIGKIRILSPAADSWLDPSVPGYVSWADYSGAKSYKYSIVEMKYNSSTGQYDDSTWICSNITTTSTSFSLSKSSNNNLSSALKSKGAYRIIIEAFSKSTPSSSSLIGQNSIQIYMTTASSNLDTLQIVNPVSNYWLDPQTPGIVQWSAYSGAASYRYTIREQKYDSSSQQYVNTDNYICQLVPTSSISFSLDKKTNDELTGFLRSQGAYMVWIGAYSDTDGKAIIAQNSFRIYMTQKTTETPNLTNPQISKTVFDSSLYTGTYSV